LLYEIAIANIIEVEEEANEGIAIGLLNIADDQIRIGELDAAESNLKRSLDICREITDEHDEAIGHQELGLLYTYLGKFKESEKELGKARESFILLGQVQSLCVVWRHHTILSFLRSNAEEAILFAKMARELADIYMYERDIIGAEYLLGAAHFIKGNFVEAEKHLTDALTCDRKINLVELEPDILLEFARLRFKQNHKKEALKFAEEALQIADRCEYRLKQTDVLNFLAEFYLDAGDLEKAKKHGEIAKERAECGYKPALEKAEKLLDKVKFNKMN